MSQIIINNIDNFNNINNINNFTFEIVNDSLMLSPKDKNFTFKIVNNSLILTPKVNLSSHIEVGKTIIYNNNKYIIKYFMGTYLSNNKPLRIVSYNEKNVNSFEIFNINTNTIIDIDVDGNIIIHKK